MLWAFEWIGKRRSRLVRAGWRRFGGGVGRFERIGRGCVLPWSSQYSSSKCIQLHESCSSAHA